MTMDQQPHAHAKRPYTTPVLQGQDLFGAEAATGSCCRATTGTCSLSTRTSLRLTID